MDIKDLAKKYNLSKDDFWPLERKNKKTGELFTVAWIIKHDAVEKIMAIETMCVTNYESLYQDVTNCRMWIEVTKFKSFADDGDGYKHKIKTVSTIGEASKENCTSTYYGAMAEKRGIDRAVLKIINAYEYGIYSDSESDDFKKPVESNLATVNQLDTIRRYNEQDKLLAFEYMKATFNKTMLPSLTKDEASAIISMVKDND